MDSMERMAAALSHKTPDRVPVYPILSGVTRNLVGANYRIWSTDAKVCADALIASTREFDIDCVVTLIDLSVECTAWGQPLIFPENEAAHPDYAKCVITDLDEYAKIKKVDYKTCERMTMHIEVIRRLAAELKGKKPIVAFVFGPLGVLSMLRGQQDMYMDLYDDPDAIQAAVGEITETLDDYVAALCEAGADAVMFDTLFASGSIMSKQMWKDMEAEPMRKLADTVRAHGAMVMVHNCGQKIYFDVQIEAMNPAAISFLYPPDDCKDYADAKRKYGDKVTLIGCVTPANAVIGTDEEWDAQCKSQIDQMAEGGGFVLATGCEYPANASFDRAQRMIDIAKTYGKYEN